MFNDLQSKRDLKKKDQILILFLPPIQFFSFSSPFFWFSLLCSKGLYLCLYLFNHWNWNPLVFSCFYFKLVPFRFAPFISIQDSVKEKKKVDCSLVRALDLWCLFKVVVFYSGQCLRIILKKGDRSLLLFWNSNISETGKQTLPSRGGQELGKYWGSCRIIFRGFSILARPLCLLMDLCLRRP